MSSSSLVILCSALRLSTGEGSLKLRHIRATVDPQDLSGHVSGCITEQEQDRADNVVHLGNALHGNCFGVRVNIKIGRAIFIGTSGTLSIGSLCRHVAFERDLDF